MVIGQGMCAVPVLVHMISETSPAFFDLLPPISRILPYGIVRPLALRPIKDVLRKNYEEFTSTYNVIL